MSSIQIQAVVFDCDGVMFDTLRANRAYYDTLLAHFERPPMTDAQFAFAHMHTVFDTVAHLFEDAESIAAAHVYRQQRDYAPFARLMELEPGLKPLIKRVRPPLKTAVATNRTDTIGGVIRSHGLQDCFDAVVCALDVPNGKPHPDMLLKVCGELEVRPDRALYVGDSKVDEQAANAAEMPLAAYRNPSLKAQHYIESLSELAAILV